MIEYDGAMPIKKEDSVVEPCASFALLKARFLRKIGGEGRRRRLGKELLSAIGDYDAIKTRSLILAGAPLGLIGYEGHDASAQQSALSEAASRRGNFGASAARLLLDAGADPDLRTGWNERTPASLALMHGQWEGALAILERAKRPLALDSDGVGLWAAAIFGVSKNGLSAEKERLAEKTMALIAGLKADPNQTLGESALWVKEGAPLALAVEWPVIVKTLLKAGANPNAKDSKGATALMRAAGKQTKGSISLLLEAGASSMEMDNNGRDALDWLVHGEQKGSAANGARWGRDTEKMVDRLMVERMPKLKRSRLDGVREEDAQPWHEKVRAFEERQTLLEETKERAQAIGRSIRM